MERAPTRATPGAPLRDRAPWTDAPVSSVVADRRILCIARGTHAGRKVEAPPTRLGVAYLQVLFALWVLNLVDLVLTVHWIGHAGWAAEGNVIMRGVAGLFGAAGFGVYKVLLMTFVVLALWWMYRRFESESAGARGGWQQPVLDGMRAAAMVLTVGLLGFYVWVVWNNLRIIGLL